MHNCTLNGANNNVSIFAIILTAIKYHIILQRKEKPTFPYCNLKYGSHFPDLSFEVRSFPSTATTLIFLPVLEREFDDPYIDFRELTLNLFKRCEPSENCHSFNTSLTVNCKMHINERNYYCFSQ